MATSPRETREIEEHADRFRNGHGCSPDVAALRRELDIHLVNIEDRIKSERMQTDKEFSYAKEAIDVFNETLKDKLANTNEWRAESTDRAATYMTIAAWKVGHDGVESRIAALERQRLLDDGRDAAERQSAVVRQWIVGLLVPAVLSLLIAGAVSYISRPVTVASPYVEQPQQSQLPRMPP